MTDVASEERGRARRSAPRDGQQQRPSHQAGTDAFTRLPGDGKPGQPARMPNSLAGVLDRLREAAAACDEN
jgi:hypothetical protein